MTKYDKELDTRTKEYEEATKPAPRDHRQDDPKNDQPKTEEKQPGQK